MSTSADNGIWKLFLSALAFIIIIELFVNLTVQPFIENGVLAPSETSQQLSLFVLIANGTVFNSLNIDLGLFTIPIGGVMNFIYELVVPSSLIDFAIGQINVFSYIPTLIQVPLIVMLIASFGIVIYTLVAMLIP